MGGPNAPDWDRVYCRKKLPTCQQCGNKQVEGSERCVFHCSVFFCQPSSLGVTMETLLMEMVVTAAAKSKMDGNALATLVPVCYDFQLVV